MSERKDYRIKNINQEFAERRSLPEIPSRGVAPIDISDSEIKAATKILNSTDPCFDMGNTPDWAKSQTEGKNPFQKADDKFKGKDDDGDDDGDKDDKGDDDNKEDDGKKKKAKVIVKVEESEEKSSEKPIYKHSYSKEAVDKAIASSNRSGRRIGGKEAAKIHRLLKGWRNE